jgi:hypothetical protein
MAEYRVEITDSRRRSMKILVRLPANRQGSWQTLDKGYLRYEGGVTDLGKYPASFDHRDFASSQSWISLFGGPVVDDSKLVLHLNGFSTFTGVNGSGKGFLYKQDYINLEPGDIEWRLIG